MAADILVQGNISIDPSKLYRVGNKIVHPLTLTENDDKHYLMFKIDFDGDEQAFTESDHKLDIAVAKDTDVTIPLLVDYPTDTPQDISKLSYAIWNRYQYYQFAVDVKAKSVLVVETPDMNTTDIEITIANRAIGVEQSVWKSNINSEVGHAKGWYFENATFVVVQVRVPIGLHGNVVIGQRNVTEPLMGVSHLPNGNLVEDTTSPVLAMLNNGTETRLSFNYITNNTTPVVQLFNAVSFGQAIAAKRVSGIFFAQGLTEVRDYVTATNALVYRNGKTGPWAYVGLTGVAGYNTNESEMTHNFQVPTIGMDFYDIYAVFEFITGGFNVHYYHLDANYVPISYAGHNFVPWTYDENKPITVISRGGISALGDAYNVNAGDLGPLRTDFVVSHNYDIAVTDVTEV